MWENKITEKVSHNVLLEMRPFASDRLVNQGNPRLVKKSRYSLKMINNEPREEACNIQKVIHRNQSIKNQNHSDQC